MKSQLGLDAELKVGNPGEFTVWVDSQKVASKKGDVFPEEKELVSSVKASLKT